MFKKCDHNFKPVNVKYKDTNIVLKRKYQCTECGKVINQETFIDYMEVSYNYGK